MLFDSYGKYIFYDGAMGTMLYKYGLISGEKPDLMNITNPGAVEEVHRMYVEAGSDIICTNTFGSNSLNLADTGHTPAEIITAAVSIAKRASNGKAKVSLDIGSTGQLIEPYGDLEYDEAYEMFKEMAVAGEKAGADFVTIETMSDLPELKAAMTAVGENTELPMLVTMTFDITGTTYMGCSAEMFVEAAEALGASALGLNCSLEPPQMYETAKRIANATILPLIVKPNAGLPDKAKGGYHTGAKEFAEQMTEFAKIGARIVGGCCGTTPEYIKELKETFNKLKGYKYMKDIFSPTNILIPESVSLESWAVIACDQFSSERAYWERVRKNAGDKPSTLNMIIPEAYLEDIDEEKEIGKISSYMDEYLKSNIFREYKDSFIYVERTQPDGRVRKGIVGAVDLEEYDFTGVSAAIRASEGTVLDRLPPRIRIRRAALLELPHIITFIDDKEATVIEPIAEIADGLPLAYDFDLMEGGGHIKGRVITGDDAENIMKAMQNLHERNEMLMIMGDGNHSLAAAKVYWDELKKDLSDDEKETHPARRALVELNNVYDPAISFEAIHRVLFNIDADKFISDFKNAMPQGTDYTILWSMTDKTGEIGIKADCIGDMLTLMQDFIDKYISGTDTVVDYIHGDESTKKLSESERCVGLILPAMDKSDFFETVEKSGVFPRKSFSVGHAEDKRYYLECKIIRG